MYYLDSHVHLDYLENFPVMLDSCLYNFAGIRQSVQGGTPLTGMLLLAEIQGQDIAANLLEYAQKECISKGDFSWRIGMTSEPGSLLCVNERGDSLFCVLGTQVNSLEKVEILQFGPTPKVPGQPLQDYLSVSSNPGQKLIIAPWGVGKWLGRRGRLIRNMLEQKKERFFALGDNGNRPGWWFFVPQFTVALEHNIPVLRGTDPLFLTGQLQRVGTFGHIMDHTLDPDFPLQSLCAHLQGGPEKRKPYGNLQKTIPFLRSQAALRRAKGGV